MRFLRLVPEEDQPLEPGRPVSESDVEVPNLGPVGSLGDLNEVSEVLELKFCGDLSLECAGREDFLRILILEPQSAVVIEFYPKITFYFVLQSPGHPTRSSFPILCWQKQLTLVALRAGVGSFGFSRARRSRRSEPLVQREDIVESKSRLILRLDIELVLNIRQN